jgi:hypothetical protein
MRFERPARETVAGKSAGQVVMVAKTPMRDRVSNRIRCTVISNVPHLGRGRLPNHFIPESPRFFQTLTTISSALEPR